MIPLKLTLNNFMCYRSDVPPLSLDGIHVACLCGDNGHGKSALLDAITWALWGKSRARSDDDLIHQGQLEMEVQLEFTAGGQRYRVLRKRTKKSGRAGTGQSVLELQVERDSDFKAITGNSIAATEQTIIDLLHLDYETFKNSAFLQQGHADEFSIKLPSKRKEILANILDLSRYDKLEMKAKNEAEERKTEVERLSNSIQEIERQLIGKIECEAEIEKAQVHTGQLINEKLKAEAVISALRDKKQSLEIKKTQLENTDARVREEKQKLATLQDAAHKCSQNIASFSSILAQSEAIENGYSQFVVLNDAINKLNQKLRQLLELREKIKNSEQTVERAFQELCREQTTIQTRVVELEESFNNIDLLEGRLVQAHNRISEMQNLEQEIGDNRNSTQKLSFQISHLESANVVLDKEITNLKDKLGMLAQETRRCPLCDSELGIVKAEELRVKLATEMVNKDKSRVENDKELSIRKTELSNVEKELAGKESFLAKERAKWQVQISVVEKELVEARQAGQQLIKERSRLEEIEQCLSKKEYAIHEQQVLSALKDEETALDYNKEEHESLNQKLAEFKEYQKQKQELDEAASAIDRENAALAEIKKNAANTSMLIEEHSKKREVLKTEIAGMGDTYSKLAKAEEDYQSFLKEEREIRDKLAALQERLQRLYILEREKRKKEKLLHHIEQEVSAYRDLADAFSKKGIQALLIERAIPEIEMEANRLLGKMTNNRMSLTLETQREKKTSKGETIETLDINIADELGTRNYEMYSGGEAFRIDLALRIALSKLLVRRAGASLPILIIDEGFGTQDSFGKERMVETINSIQDDFEKIIIITHLEELKDMFPVTINITKTANGSTISVN